MEMIRRGTLLVDVDGATVGQINGIAVLQAGDYTFGKPIRITARSFLGNRGVINIEREADLSGRIHNKGVLILSHYLGGKFAQNKPLALWASLGVRAVVRRGGRVTAPPAAELYALLSELSGLPIDQGIAVTGSVNQKGEMQPIGGVNEKIEGFFHACKVKGLTGRQGVMIPRANVENLMLKEEVVQAIAEGRFHVWAVDNVDQGIEILTGVPAGDAGRRRPLPGGFGNRAGRPAPGGHGRPASAFRPRSRRHAGPTGRRRTGNGRHDDGETAGGRTAGRPAIRGSRRPDDSGRPEGPDVPERARGTGPARKS